MYKRPSFMLAFVAGVAFGCGGDDNGDDAASLSSSSQGLCSKKTAEPYESGMAKTTPGGVSVRLMESMPAPPTADDNEWVLRLEDDSGRPLTDAAILVRPTMPEHGHGTPREPVVTELVEGEYRVKPVALFMPGVWNIEVEVSGGSAALTQAEVANFVFCVE